MAFGGDDRHRKDNAPTREDGSEPEAFHLHPPAILGVLIGGAVALAYFVALMLAVEYMGSPSGLNISEGVVNLLLYGSALSLYVVWVFSSHLIHEKLR